MFTGLIEEVGYLESISPIGGGRRLKIRANKIIGDVAIDDSVAVSGACQTVVAYSASSIEVEAVEETLRKTTLGKLRPGAPVNLERAMRLGDRLGGHMVQGHVDTTGAVQSIEPQQTGILIWIDYPAEFRKWVVPQGSITIDGVSLTVARTEGSRLMVSIIPHTWKMTTLAKLANGSRVNLEFDILGKYIERITTARLAAENEKPRGNSSLEQFINQPDY
ncbi:MAG: riboflavin synthase [Candidatus Kapaibacterium sp.]